MWAVREESTIHISIDSGIVVVVGNTDNEKKLPSYTLQPSACVANLEIWGSNVHTLLFINTFSFIFILFIYFRLNLFSTLTLWYSFFIFYHFLLLQWAHFTLIFFLPQHIYCPAVCQLCFVFVVRN